jgi:hypothetical protein
MKTFKMKDPEPLRTIDFQKYFSERVNQANATFVEIIEEEPKP